jgi:hypothetical protein
MNRRHAPTLSVLFVVCGVLSAVPGAGVLTAEEPSAATATFSPATIELLDSGAEPRRQIRYGEKSASRQLTTTTSSVLGSALGEGDPTETPVPTVVMRVRMAMMPVAGNDHRRFEIEIEDARLEDDPPTNPMIRAILERFLPHFPGFKGHLLTEASGLGIETSLIKTAASDEQRPVEALHELMWLYPIAFPEEAIGVGARWRVSRELVDYAIKENLHVLRRVDYELTGVEGGRLHISVGVSDDGKTVGEGFPDPMNPPMDLPALTSTGTGRVVLDADGCTLVSGSYRRTTEFELTVEVGGQSMPGRGSAETNLVIELTPVADTEGDAS